MADVPYVKVGKPGVSPTIRISADSEKRTEVGVRETSRRLKGTPQAKGSWECGCGEARPGSWVNCPTCWQRRP